MAEMAVDLAALGVEWPPTEDELPYDDGMPMESARHVMQLQLLMDPLRVFWADRQDVYVAGNMFVYFSLEQVRNQDFRGPDFFAVLGVPRRERKSWVVWQEGKGPDVVIELLSESTAAIDKGEKKLVYQERLRVPEYFWFDPFSAEWAGFALHKGIYEPIPEDEQGRLNSKQLALALVRWQGIYHDVEARWLRWATLAGELLPTPQEIAVQERQHANEVQQHANEVQQRADEVQQRADKVQQRADEVQQRADEVQQRADEAQQRADEAQQRAAELEALLARYRERFGDAPE